MVPIPERRPKQRRALKVVNARGNNLKNITAEIPLGVFTAITGVSGGGKSEISKSIADAIFTGDVLLAPSEGSGRCDVPGADAGKTLPQVIVTAALESDGAIPVGSTPAQYRALLVTEIERWKKVVQDNGIKIEE